ncbi:hypothetical protein BJ878DRAFT_116229 [Calycina marina]|uniref:Uncharacterized protein n=1 Tax=Calycina marina TaxID=1763456 RepID=A0A9P7Z155_9HELO|nr:hypothetical protein BJ878DRAFT_116229 [Calycina marina]
MQASLLWPAIFIHHWLYLSCNANFAAVLLFTASTLCPTLLCYVAGHVAKNGKMAYRTPLLPYSLPKPLSLSLSFILSLLRSSSRPCILDLSRIGRPDPTLLPLLPGGGPSSSISTMISSSSCRLLFLSRRSDTIELPTPYAMIGALGSDRSRRRQPWELSTDSGSRTMVSSRR